MHSLAAQCDDTGAQLRPFADFAGQIAVVTGRDCLPQRKRNPLGINPTSSQVDWGSAKDHKAAVFCMNDIADAGIV